MRISQTGIRQRYKSCQGNSEKSETVGVSDRGKSEKGTSDGVNHAKVRQGKSAGISD